MFGLGSKELGNSLLWFDSKRPGCIAVVLSTPQRSPLAG